METSRLYMPLPAELGGLEDGYPTNMSRLMALSQFGLSLNRARSQPRSRVHAIVTETPSVCNNRFLASARSCASTGNSPSVSRARARHEH
jgi:hypothetical protein